MPRRDTAADEGLAQTAEHAARGKALAVSEGYWPDAFARHFVPPHALHGPSPGPMINRGQYARVAAVRSVCEQFLATTAAKGLPAQIISLGAGFDTLFWQLHAAGTAPRLFVELDQSSVVTQKGTLIASTPALLVPLNPVDRLALFGGGRDGPEAISAAGAAATAGPAAGGLYRLLAADLNEVSHVAAALEAAGWRAGEPTLVVAECVLVYMDEPASTALLSWFASTCPRAVLVSYEMIHPHDPFGRMMVDNLRRRGCPLLGLPAIPDVAAQEARCVERAGWTRASGMSMLAFYEQVVTPAERQRVGKIGLLDELEEYRMLLEHYCVLLAVCDREAAAGEAGEAAGDADHPARTTRQAADEAVAEDAATAEALPPMPVPVPVPVAPGSAAEPIFAGLDLRRPVTLADGGAARRPPAGEPPLPGEEIGYGSNYGDGSLESGAAASAPKRVMGSMLNAKHPVPMGETFREEDEDAAWSDEEDGAGVR